MAENSSELDPTFEELDPITKHEAYLELLEKQLKDAQALPNTATKQKLINALREEIAEAEYNRPTLPPSSC